MKNAISVFLTLTFVLTTSAAFGYGSYGTDVNNYCPSPDPYAGDCTLCHTTNSKSETTEARDAYAAGNLEYFCPAPVDPNAIDDDGDGYSENQGDCNDAVFSINPGVAEVLYNGIDENCNGMADDVVDADSDGFNSNVDCNDNNASINPGAAEVLYNGIDENCNGMTDDVVDADSDGFNSDVDCNDNNASINPGVAEVLYNGIDENCNGMTDDVVDADSDGFNSNVDCNDNNASINPDATEILSNGIDENCNGMADDTPVITDTDGDGVIDDNDNCPNTPAGTIVDANGCEIVDETPVITDTDGDSYDAISFGGNDCNDADAAINPGSAERCEDNIDNNCDGLTDGQDTQACPAPSPICTDDDGDKFYAQADCNTVQDCNDNDGQTFPGATELCGDAIDNDCDGNVDENCDIANEYDGAALYQNLCASCHGELPNTEVCGKDAENIMDAIKDNKGGMSALSPLTDAQVKYIAEALSNCNKGEADDSDSDSDYGDSDSDSDYDDDGDRH